jgi:hypothetical protein
MLAHILVAWSLWIICTAGTGYFAFIGSLTP